MGMDAEWERTRYFWKWRMEKAKAIVHVCYWERLKTVLVSMKQQEHLKTQYDVYIWWCLHIEYYQWMIYHKMCRWLIRFRKVDKTLSRRREPLRSGTLFAYLGWKLFTQVRLQRLRWKNEQMRRSLIHIHEMIRCTNIHSHSLKWSVVPQENHICCNVYDFVVALSSKEKRKTRLTAQLESNFSIVNNLTFIGLGWSMNILRFSLRYIIRVFNRWLSIPTLPMTSLVIALVITSFPFLWKCQDMFFRKATGTCKHIRVKISNKSFHDCERDHPHVSHLCCVYSV